MQTLTFNNNGRLAPNLPNFVFSFKAPLSSILVLDYIER